MRCDARKRMAEIMEGQFVWQLREITSSLEPPPLHIPMRERPASVRGEDKIIGLREARRQLMPLEQRNHVVREWDAPDRLRGLRLRQLAHPRELPADVQHGFLQVDVLPLEPEQLSEPKAGVDRDAK